VTIPASVTSIGEQAFYGGYCEYYSNEDGEYQICNQLDELFFSEGSQLTTIGELAF
jgi:hypothetical protein